MRFRLPIATATSVVGLAVLTGAPVSASLPDTGSPRWTGLAAPESVQHDRRRDTYLVSNINGPVAAKDNNGYIARLDPSGGDAERWIEGGRRGVTLHAPKGLALTAKMVWVADIDTVRGFDRPTGRPVTAIRVPGATFLNDIAVGPDGGLYVTDSGVGPDGSGAIVPTGTDAVHRIDPRGAIRTVAAGTRLDQPNGIVVRPDGTMLVGTRRVNQVLTIDRTGRVTDRRAVPGNVVDGIALLPDGRLAVTTWQPGGLWQLHRDGSAGELVPGLRLTGAADFSIDRRRSRLLLPALLDNELQLVTIPDRPRTGDR